MWGFLKECEDYWSTQDMSRLTGALAGLISSRKTGVMTRNMAIFTYQGGQLAGKLDAEPQIYSTFSRIVG